MVATRKGERTGHNNNTSNYYYYYYYYYYFVYGNNVLVAAVYIQQYNLLFVYGLFYDAISVSIRDAIIKDRGNFARKALRRFDIISRTVSLQHLHL
jgi:hypothetical protein